MIEPYPPKLQEKVWQLAEQLDDDEKGAPPEAFLATLHVIHLLAERVKFSDLPEDADSDDWERSESEWENYLSKLHRTMLQHSSEVDPVQTRVLSYLQSLGILIGMLQALPGNGLGEVQPSKRSPTSPRLLPDPREQEE